MGYTTSTVHGIEVPDSSEANNVPEDIGKVVTALEGGSLVKRLTQAQINALTSPQKPAGLVVYNTTTNKLQISDGSGFADYVAGTPVHAIGVKTGSTSLSYNTYTTVTWTAETDPAGILGSTDATLPSAGVYALSGYASVTSDTTDMIVQTHLQHNGADVALEVRQLSAPAIAVPASMSLSAVIVAATSDTIRMRVYNSCTVGTQSLTAARMSLVKVGA